MTTTPRLGGVSVTELAMYRFRLTDGATHAEEFYADNLSRFRREILSAFQRFRSTRAGVAALRLHAWDGEWWVDVRNRRMRPLSFTERAVFEAADRLWVDAEITAWGACNIVRQMSALVAFVRMSPQELRAYRRHQLTLVDGGLS